MTAARSRRRGGLVVLSLLAALVLFALGIAVGEALNDNPKPGGTQTLTRTLKVLELTPAVVTVTVTTTKP
jgi:hypothetical protein